MFENSLANETSPYLLQHKDNPVHWFAWSPEAFAEARRLNKPILLSIGYAACHWCHVMAHESFEDQATAQLMNDLFINIKVDREERPDIDKIYMDAIHSLGEQGGWPLTMFLTPRGEPFWGGTYFPKTPQYGRPSFGQVLREISRIWHDEHHKVETNSRAIKQALESKALATSGATLTASHLHEAADMIVRAVDLEHGGLQGAPKFPQSSTFAFLWQAYCRNSKDERLRIAVETTLTHICQGGIYDHLAGGIARYSVDHVWLVPHFEKMLYDNALLVELLSNVWARTGNELFRIRIEETIAWMERDMLTSDGAFAASYDADSEGVEGKYYVWSAAEIEDILANEGAKLFCDIYDVSPGGNWEGVNILNRSSSSELRSDDIEAKLASMRAKLLAHRATRIPPGWDDKILADWNGLAIRAFATAGLLLDQQRWIQTAQNTFEVILDLLWKDGVLYQAHRHGKTQHLATADGYANLIASAIALYRATGRYSYIQQAEALTEELMKNFWNEEQGGFYFSSLKADNLIVRSHYAHDDATPNANATMLQSLTDLALVTGSTEYEAKARQIHDAFASQVSRVLLAHASFLTAFDHHREPFQAVFTHSTDDPDLMPLRQAYLERVPPTGTIIYADGSQELPAEHIAKANATASKPALFICRGQTCSPPVMTLSDLDRVLG